MKIQKFFIIVACTFYSQLALGITTYTWNGKGSVQWSNASNWDPGALTSGVLIDLSFPTMGGSYSINNDIPGLEFQDITINATAGYTISGLSIAAKNSLLNTLAFSGASHSMGLPIVLSGPLTVTQNYTSNSCILSGPISNAIGNLSGLTKSGPGVLVLSANNTYVGGTTINNGTISISTEKQIADSSLTTLIFANGTLKTTGVTNLVQAVTLSTNGGTINTGAATTIAGIVSGTTSLTKTGSDTLTLTGANSGSWSTTINAGTLAISPATSLGSGTVTLAGGTLSTTGTVSAPNAFAVTNNSSITSAGTTTLSGTLTESAGKTLTVAGAGVLVLTGANNTYLGTTAISAGGTLQIGNGAAAGTLWAGDITNAGTLAFNLPSSSSVTLAGAISGTGTLTQNGAGALTLSGANNTYLGGTTITAGTLSISSDKNIGSGPVTLAGGTLQVTGAATFPQAITLTGNGSLDNGVDIILNGPISQSPSTGSFSFTKTSAGKVTLGNASNSGAAWTTSFSGGTVSIASSNYIGSGAFTFNGGTLQVTGAAAFPQAIILTGNGTLDNGTGADVILNGPISQSPSTGSFSFTKTSAGKVTLGNASNSATAWTTSFSGGTVSIGAAGNIGSGAFTFNGGTLQVTGAATFPQAIILTGSGTLDNGADVILNGPISQNPSTGNFSFTKTSAGKVTLGNASNSGAAWTTSFSGGTVSVAGAGYIGSGAFTFNGGTLQVTGTTTFPQAIILTGNGTLDNGTGADVILNGPISQSPSTGSFSFTKTSACKVTLGNASNSGAAWTTSFSGGTVSVASSNYIGSGAFTFNGGTLQVTGAATFPQAIILTGNGTLDNGTGADVILNGPISQNPSTGNFSFTKTSAGKVTLGNASNSNAAWTTSFNGGIVSVAGAGNIGSGAFTFNGGTLQATGTATFPQAIILTGNGKLDNGADVILNGLISGSSSFTKTGVAKVTLGNIGNSSAAWTTSFNGGIVSVAGAGYIGSGDFTFNGGILQATGAATFPQAIILTGNGTLDNGADVILNGPISQNPSTGSFSFTKTSAGKVTLGNASNSGAAWTTSFSGGTVSIASSDYIGSGAFTFNGGILQVTGAAAFPQAIILTGNGTLDNGADVILNGPISQSPSTGSFSFTKTSAGKVTLGNANNSNAAWTTSFNGGIVSVAGAGYIGSGAFTFNGGTLQVTGTAAFPQAIILTGNGTLDNGTGADVILNGPVSQNPSTGNFSFTKTSAGKVTLGNASNSNAAWTTSFNGGIVSVAGAGNIGSGAFTFNGGTLQATGTATFPQAIILTGNGKLDNGADVILNGLISSSSSFTKTGVAKVTLGNIGNSSAAWTTSFNGGIVSVAGAGYIGSGDFTFNGGILQATGAATFPQAIILTGNGTLDNGADVILNGPISQNPSTGSFSFTKTSAGKVTLGNASNSGAAWTTSFSGGTVSIASSDYIGSGAFTFNGGILQVTGAAAFPQAIILTGNGTLDNGADVILNGPISQSPSTGSFSFTKTSAGKVTLGNANNSNAAWTTSFNGGIVSVAGAGNIGSGDFTFNGGTLQATGTATFPQAIILTGNGTLDNGADVILNGLVSGSSSFTKTGVAKVTLGNTGNSGAAWTTSFNGGIVSVARAGNIGSGDFTFNGGTLQATGTAAFPQAIILTGNGSLDNGADVILNGPISQNPSTGSFSFTKTSAGKVTLGNANNSNAAWTTSFNGGIVSVAGARNIGSGAFTFNGGTLQATGTATFPQAITLTGNGTLDNGADVILNGLISGSSSFIKTGAGKVTLGNAHNSGAAWTTSFNGGIVSAAGAGYIGSGDFTFNGGTLQITDTATFPQAIVLTGNGTLDNGTDVILNGLISGSSSFTKQGAGTLTLRGANRYTGATSIKEGTLFVGTVGALPAATAVDLSGTGVLNLNGVAQTIANLSGTAGTVHLGTGTAAGSLTVGDATATSTFAGSIVDGGIAAGSLTKVGSGMLVLNGINSYSGTTTIKEGTLLVGVPGALPSTTIVELSGTGVLNLNGIAQTVANLSGSGGTIQLSTSTAGSLTVGDSTTAATSPPSFAGNIVDGGTATGSLIKNGAGTLILSGTNSYSGVTTILEGTLQIDSDFGLPSNSDLAFGPPSTSGIVPNLVFNNSGTLTYAGKISGSNGALTMQGSGTVILNGSIQAAIDIKVNNGTISLGDSIDQITVETYTQSNNGIYNNAITPVNGGTDKMIVNGVATLGGTLNIIPDPGVYLPGNTYSILTANGELIGNFDRITIANSNLSLSQVSIQRLANSVQFTNNSVLLTILGGGGSGGSIVFFAGTPTENNARAVFNYLEKNVDHFGSDLVNVVNALTPLVDPTEALDQLQPAIFGAFDLLNTNTSSYVTSIFSHRIPKACSLDLKDGDNGKKISVWSELFGYYMDQKRIGEQTGFQANVEGVLLGLDYTFHNEFLIGLGGGYNKEHIHWKMSRGKGNIDSGYLGVYANWVKRYFNVEASLLGGINSYDASRNIQFSSVNRTAKHAHKGYDLTAHCGGGGDIPVGKSIHFKPFFNADYLYLTQNGFTEHGANSLNLRVEAKHSHMLRSEVGISFAKSYSFSHSGCFSSTLFFSGINEAYLCNQYYKASLDDLSGEFKVKSFNQPITLFSPGIDFSYASNNSLSFALRYSAELNGKIQTQKGDIRFECKF